jgi:hypothetical protein
MASGTIHGTTTNQYIKAKIEWSYDQDYSNNLSVVNAKLYYYKGTNSITYGTGSFTIHIGEKETTVSKYIELYISAGWVCVAEFQVQVKHNANGQMEDLPIYASGGISGTTFIDTYCADYIKLDTIPRASTISFVRDTTLGESCLVRWTPLATGFKYKLSFSLGNWSKTTGYITPSGTSQFEWEAGIPLEVANHISTTSKTGTMTVTLHSYTSGGELMSPTSSKTFTVTIPDNEETQPTVDMSLSPSIDYNSLYIQGLSKVKASLVFGTRFGATVVASSVTADKLTFDVKDGQYESGVLAQTGTVSIKATVKDSRGFYGTYYKEIEVIPYAKPYVRAKSGESEIIVARCDKDGNLANDGTHLKIRAKVVYSDVKNNNYGGIKFCYRAEGGKYSPWETILNCETDANHSDEVIAGPLLNGGLKADLNYQVQLVAFDDFGDSAPITFAIPSVEVYMDRPNGGKSMGLGGYSSGDGNLDVYWNIKARGGLSLIDSSGVETPVIASAQLNPHKQLDAGWNPDTLANGIYAVSGSKPLQVGTNVIMRNGVLIQMSAYEDGSVKIQLALTSDEDKNPYYRVHWYGSWGNWRSLKI